MHLVQKKKQSGRWTNEKRKLLENLFRTQHYSSMFSQQKVDKILLEIKSKWWNTSITVHEKYWLYEYSPLRWEHYTELRTYKVKYNKYSKLVKYEHVLRREAAFKNRQLAEQLNFRYMKSTSYFERSQLLNYAREFESNANTILPNLVRSTLLYKKFQIHALHYSQKFTSTHN